ncbi:MAG TPA: DUF1080 domain-containing protein [Chthonomonadales bacterium]|nr:DUF1080 domain-containing protein [Chthonomonadales bacterium]
MHSVAHRAAPLLRALGVLAALTCAGGTAAAGQARAGYTDTPFLPGGQWRVHDPARPDPPAGTPQRGVPGDTPRPAPRGAVVLFDGTSLAAWRTPDGGAPHWPIEGGLMVSPAGGGDLESRQHFGDAEVNVEWRLPPRRPEEERSASRANSGVFLMGLFQVQIFDSYGPDIMYADGQAGAIFGQYPPRVDVCRAPGEWQSFRIRFWAPRVRGGVVVEPAIITVRHNGVLIHDRVRLLGPTQHRALAAYGPNTPTEGPLRLQGYGRPVAFRNIWVRPLR